MAIQKPTNECVTPSLQAKTRILLDNINNLCDFNLSYMMFAMPKIRRSQYAGLK